MAATSAMVSRLRRMTNELFDASTYTDEDMTSAIEGYPVSDDDGHLPTDIDWVAGYDLHAAAANIWAEKAGIAAQDYNYSADGGNFNRSSVYDQYMRQCRYHEARRQPQSIMPVLAYKLPVEWIGNLPEDDV